MSRMKILMTLNMLLGSSKNVTLWINGVPSTLRAAQRQAGKKKSLSEEELISAMILISYLYILSLKEVIAHIYEAPKVTVAEGELEGKYFTTRDGRIISGFLGIPFAKPPVGDLRFRSPEPPTQWYGVRDATIEGPPCVQNNLLDFRSRNVTFGSEDCLYLNVFTPKLSSSAKLPVMVYIYGGGFFSGSPTVRMYGPDFLLDKDVVLVVINYRVGPLDQIKMYIYMTAVSIFILSVIMSSQHYFATDLGGSATDSFTSHAALFCLKPPPPLHVLHRSKVMK